MQHFRAGGESLGDVVADTDRLREFASPLRETAEPIAFPPGLEDRVVGDAKRAKVFLQQELPFEFERIFADEHLAVQRGAEEVGGRIREAVNHLHARVLPACFAAFLVVAVVLPVGKIEAELEAVGHAEFEFVAKLENVRVLRAAVVGVFPRHPVFKLHTAFRGGGRLVGVAESALARGGGEGGGESGGEDEESSGGFVEHGVFGLKPRTVRYFPVSRFPEVAIFCPGLAAGKSWISPARDSARSGKVSGSSP